MSCWETCPSLLWSLSVGKLVKLRGNPQPSKLSLVSWWCILILKSIQAARNWAAKIGSQSVRMYVAEWSWPWCWKSWTVELTVSGASVNLVTVAAASPAVIFLLSKSTAQQTRTAPFQHFFYVLLLFLFSQQKLQSFSISSLKWYE